MYENERKYFNLIFFSFLIFALIIRRSLDLERVINDKEIKNLSKFDSRRILGEGQRADEEKQ